MAVNERSDLFRTARLDDLLDGMTPAELVLRYTLSHPHCHTTIVGTLNVEHLRTNMAAAQKGPLPADVVREIRSRVEAAGAH